MGKVPHDHVGARSIDQPQRFISRRGTLFINKTTVPICRSFPGWESTGRPWCSFWDAPCVSFFSPEDLSKWELSHNRLLLPLPGSTCLQVSLSFKRSLAFLNFDAKLGGDNAKNSANTSNGVPKIRAWLELGSSIRQVSKFFSSNP